MVGIPLCAQQFHIKGAIAFEIGPLQKTRFADFQSRDDEAPRFVIKGRKLRLVYAPWDDRKVVQPDGRHAQR